MAETVLYKPLSPVEFLEADYDSWKFHRWTVGNVQYITVVGRTMARQAGHGGRLGNGPAHDQCMIRLKTDTQLDTDAEAQDRYHCNICSHGYQHECAFCEERITHMAMGECLECWYQRSGDELVTT